MAETSAPVVASATPSKEEYGPGTSVRRPFKVPSPGVVINGKLWLGRRELTYDERNQVTAMLSARSNWTLNQVLGQAGAQRIVDMAKSQDVTEIY